MRLIYRDNNEVKSPAQGMKNASGLQIVEDGKRRR